MFQFCLKWKKTLRVGEITLTGENKKQQKGLKQCEGKPIICEKQTVPTLKHDMCHYELMRRGLFVILQLADSVETETLPSEPGSFCQGGLGVHRIPGGRWDLPPPKPPLSHLGKSIVNSDHVWEISIAVVERFAYILHFENGRLIVHSDHVWGRRAK